jgi:HPt (histidine-containing phosphotransfer) domain-containing protein
LYSEEIFCEKIAGKSIFEVLYTKIDPKSEIFAKIHSALTVVFGADMMQWDLACDALPAQVTIHPTVNAVEIEKLLGIKYTPIMNATGDLERIMLIVEDLTETEKLKNELSSEKEHGREKVQIMSELVDLDQTEGENFFRTANQSLSLATTLGHQTEPPKSNDFDDIFMKIHTLKGNSRAFKLMLMSEALHRLETPIAAWRNNKSDYSWDICRKDILASVENAKQCLSRYAEIGSKVFGIEDEFEARTIQDIKRFTIDIGLTLGDFFGVDSDKSFAKYASNKKIDGLEQAKKISHTLKSTARTAHSL